MHKVNDWLKNRKDIVLYSIAKKRHIYIYIIYAGILAVTTNNERVHVHWNLSGRLGESSKIQLSIRVCVLDVSAIAKPHATGSHRSFKSKQHPSQVKLSKQNILNILKSKTESYTKKTKKLICS